MVSNGDIQKRLEEALSECERLWEENTRLHAALTQKTNAQVLAACSESSTAFVTDSSPTEEKVAVFRSLFRGRDDVYALRWENKSGRAGYSPACKNEWDRAYCQKPRVKCSECQHRVLLSVTDQVIYDHLSGRHGRCLPGSWR